MKAVINGINSIGFFDDETKRITVGDKRYYQHSKTGKYYPNLTMIIHDGWPMNPYLKKWMKEKGSEADKYLKEAGDFGSAVHDLIDRNIKGEALSLIDNSEPNVYKFKYPEEVWRSFLKFVEFRDRYKPYVYANELVTLSDYLNVGMTIDLVCKIGNENWIIDFKTSNAISDDHFIQVAAAAYTWNEFFPEAPVTRVGLLHLKAETRGEDKKGVKLQGKGWQVVEPPKHFKEYIPDFKLRMEVWKRINPDYKPLMYEIPCEVNGYINEKKPLTGKIEDKPVIPLIEDKVIKSN